MCSRVFASFSASYLFSISYSFSCNEGPKTEHSTGIEASPVLRTGQWLLCFWHFWCVSYHTVSHTSQDAICLLDQLGNTLAHVELAADQHPQGLFHWATFQPLFPHPVVLQGVVATQVPAFGLVEPSPVDLEPSPVDPACPDPSIKAFVSSSRSVCPPNLCCMLTVCTCTSSACPGHWKRLNRAGPELWVPPFVTGCQLDVTHHHCLVLAIQPDFYLKSSALIHAMISQFL